MILADKHIASLCEGVVPPAIINHYSLHGVEVPTFLDKPIVDPFDPTLINPASIDIRVGYTVKLRRKHHKGGYADIDLSTRTAEDPLPFQPGDRCLVASMETFNLPNFVCAQFRLKSSRGREWYEHMEAGFCDPKWHGSKLTMEIINMDLAPLPLYPGLKMGQLVFSLMLEPPDNDYSVTGRYNNDTTVKQSKG